MKDNKKLYPLITLFTIILLVGFLVAMILIEPLYQKITQPYFNFLENVGYYEHVYQPSCIKFCPFNLIHGLPYILFYILPIAGTILLIYYGLSNDKAYIRHLFSKEFDAEKEKIRAVDAANVKYHYLFYGIIIVFFTLIFIFIVLPMIVIIINKFK